MDQRILEFEKQFRKPNLPDIRPGDTVRVHQRVEEAGKTRIHQFEGIIIAAKHGQGLSGSFTVRKIGVGGIGVEQTFFWHAPTLFKVERTKKGQSRRAKLYYLRGLTARAGKKLAGIKAGEVWEEAAVKEQVKEEQKEQAETKSASDDSSSGTKKKEKGTITSAKTG